MVWQRVLLWKMPSNAALKELKADGTLQSIVDKYITASNNQLDVITEPRGGSPNWGTYPFFGKIRLQNSNKTGK